MGAFCRSTASHGCFQNSLGKSIGTILVLPCAAYDVTRRETFESIEDIWMKEVDMYSTVDDAVKMVVANKVDKVCVSSNNIFMLFTPSTRQALAVNLLGPVYFCLTHRKAWASLLGILYQLLQSA